MEEKQYIPQVNDYVIWTNDLGTIDEGWVYWKGDPVDNEQRKKFGWRPLQNYITIETGLRDKPECEYNKRDPHKHIHILVCCYEHQWHQLQFVKRRKSKHDQQIVQESTHMYYNEPKENHSRES
tara:strand:+ start:2544 stop:2915 length:372 start_codon:yes stop_codon:yes gene_type:complete